MNMQNTNSAFRMTWVTLAALSATMLVGVSHAASPDSAPSQTVSYQDLDLNSSAGVQALYRPGGRNPHTLGAPLRNRRGNARTLRTNHQRRRPMQLNPL